MQQQEEDIRNNMELDNSGVTGTTGVQGPEDYQAWNTQKIEPTHFWHDENNLYNSAKVDLADEFLYRMVNLMKTEKIQLKVMNRCEDLYNLVADRNEQDYDGNIDPYGGATALFDVLGHRWPNDDYSDRTTGQVLEWLAFWSMFRHEVQRYFYRKGFNAAWVGLMLDHYKTGRHDT